MTSCWSAAIRFTACATSDRVPDSGPLGGLDAALAAARDDRLVVVACDMPFVTASLFAHLLAQTQDADAVVPRTERGYHPLCAAYTRACQVAVVRRLAERRLKMLELFEDIRVHVVERHAIERFAHRCCHRANLCRGTRNRNAK